MARALRMSGTDTRMRAGSDKVATTARPEGVPARQGGQTATDPPNVSVVVLTHEFTRGGRATGSVDLTCALASVGYRVACVAHPRFGVPDHSARELAEAGAELRLLPPARPRSAGAVWRILCLLRRRAPDVVIAHSWPLVGLLAPLKSLYGDPAFVFVKRGYWAPRGWPARPVGSTGQRGIRT